MSLFNVILGQKFRWSEGSELNEMIFREAKHQRKESPNPTALELIIK